MFVMPTWHDQQRSRCHATPAIHVVSRWLMGCSKTREEHRDSHRKAAYILLVRLLVIRPGMESIACEKIPEKIRPHVVTVPLPMQGHLPSIIHLSKKLAEHGFTVTVVNVECVHAQLVKEWCCPPELDIRLEPIHLDLPTPNGTVAANNENPLAFRDAIENLQDEFTKVLDRMIERGPPVSCIISDHFLPWGLTVAKKFGIPHAIYWPGNAAWCLAEYHLRQLVSKGDLPLTKLDFSDGSGKIVHVPGLGPMQPWELPTHFEEVMFAFIGTQRSQEAADRLRNSSWILVNTAYELEAATLNAMKDKINKNTISIGPLFPFGGAAGLNLLKEDAGCLQWLDSKAPASVLYVSFGSIATLSAQQFEELARGLEASRVCFMWVIRSELLGGTSAEFYNGFMERTKEKCLVVSWAPQRELLSHAAIRAFLTHCGWNSVVESISSGVPMLALPCLYDQTLNRKLMVGDWKVALPLVKIHNDGVVDKEEVERVVNRAFGEDSEFSEIRKRVGEMKKIAVEAALEGGSSHDNLLSFMREI